MSSLYRQVLVPLDGSQHALAAIEPGRVLASAFGCPLRLVHVVPSSGGEQADVPAGTEILTGDDIAATLVEAAAGAPPSLVCISSRGRGSVSELVLGSVARHLVSAIEGPVVVVGPACERPVPSGWSGQFVVALDGSRLSAAMVTEAEKWARALDASLRLLYVVEPPTDPWWRPEVSASASLVVNELDRLAHELGDQGIVAHPVVVPDSDPAAGILRQVAPRKADLVMMSTHGRTGLARLVLGSVSADVVARSPVPVVLVRPHELRRR